MVRMRRKEVGCLLFKKNKITFQIKILETRPKVHFQKHQPVRDKLSKAWFAHILVLKK